MEKYSFTNWFMTLMVFTIFGYACQPISANSAATEPIVSTSEVVPAEVELLLGTGPFNLPNPRQGLDNLSSFKAALTVAFEGSESGQPKEWTSTYILLQTSQPVARLLSIESAQELTEESVSDPVFLGEMDGAFLEINAEGSCIINILDPESSKLDWWEPTGFLSGLFGADEAGEEELNGAVADHYTFDERALAHNGVTESSGEVWVSADGGYILKYSLTTTAGEDYFGEGIEGTLTWGYALTDINQPLTPELPEACQQQLVPAPRLPDAINVRSLAGWLKFDTSVGMEEASSFYKEQLPGLGWQLTNEPPIVAMAELAQLTPENLILLEFTQGDQVLEILISAGTDGTEVNIVDISSGE